MIRRSTPPVAAAILWLLLPPRDREHILGDLEEQYAERYARSRTRARAWYWSQVIRTAPVALTSLRWVSRERAGHPKKPGAGSLWLDVRYAFRTLSRARGFSAAAAVTLALGIGSSTALFSAVDSTLLRSLPFRDPESLVRVSLLIPPDALPNPQPQPIEMVWSYPKYRVLREQQDVFTETATYHRDPFTLSDGEGAERVWGEIVGGSYFSVLGLEPALGRDFLPEEDATPGTHYVVILGHSLWVRSFGSDRGVIGRSIRLNGVPYTIVGVGPADFNGLWGTAELWVPTVTESERALTSPGHSYGVIARLRPGVTSKRLATAMARLGAEVDEAYPSPGPGGPWSATARPLDEYRARAETRRSLLILFAAAALVLMVACVNISGLLLSRGVSRAREVAIRTALGASRTRLVRQFFVEGAVLSLQGAVLGVGLAVLGVDLFNKIGAAGRLQMLGLERLSFNSIRIDARTIAFSVMVMVLAPLAFSLLPGLASSRTARGGAFRESGLSEAPGASRTRTAVVVIQVALAFVLMVGSAQLLTAVRRLYAVNLGFDPTGVLAVRVALPNTRYDGPTSRVFIDRLMEQVRSLPEVEAVNFSNCVPFADGCRNGSLITAVDGVEHPEKARIGVTFVSPAYFEAVGIPLRVGRDFSAADVEGGPLVAVIDRNAAARFWPGADPLGRQVSIQGVDDVRVVGVAGNVRYDNLDDQPLPEVYLPTTQWARRDGYLLIRAAAGPLQLVPPIRARVRALDPSIPIFDVRTMQGRVSDALWETRFIMLLFCIFSFMTLVLAAVGLLGTQSFSVRRQARAIGVRMALGANRSRVASQVMWGGVVPTVVGIVIGIGLSLVASRPLRTFLFETDPRDPTIFFAVAVVFVLVSMVASFLPARHAAGVDPVEVLRAD